MPCGGAAGEIYTCYLCWNASPRARGCAVIICLVPSHPSFPGTRLPQHLSASPTPRVSLLLHCSIVHIPHLSATPLLHSRVSRLGPTKAVHFTPSIYEPTQLVSGIHKLDASAARVAMCPVPSPLQVLTCIDFLYPDLSVSHTLPCEYPWGPKYWPCATTDTNLCQATRLVAVLVGLAPDVPRRSPTSDPHR